MNVGTWETMYVGSFRGGEFQAVMSHLAWLLRTEFRCSVRAVCTLNHGDISLAQNVLTF